MINAPYDMSDLKQTTKSVCLTLNKTVKINFLSYKTQGNIRNSSEQRPTIISWLRHPMTSRLTLSRLQKN